ncbi:hypothetical protein [[Clostridium] aminophilum]|nr:hypothetical protein [[Clostridium] aminophilum]
MMVNKLLELDQKVQEGARIKAVHEIEKMQKEYKNKRAKKEERSLLL